MKSARGGKGERKASRARAGTIDRCIGDRPRWSKLSPPRERGERGNEGTRERGNEGNEGNEASRARAGTTDRCIGDRPRWSKLSPPRERGERGNESELSPPRGREERSLGSPRGLFTERKGKKCSRAREGEPPVDASAIDCAGLNYRRLEGERKETPPNCLLASFVQNEHRSSYSLTFPI